MVGWVVGGCVEQLQAVGKAVGLAVGVVETSELDIFNHLDIN